MNKFFLLSVIAILLVSCGYKEGVIQKADKSYLNFTGSWEKISVQIDDSEPFILEDHVVDSEGKEKRIAKSNKLYQITPGKHTVKVFRDGQLIVNRILILESDVIKEVQIP